jgi:hypothetical protein
MAAGFTIVNGRMTKPILEGYVMKCSKGNLISAALLATAMFFGTPANASGFPDDNVSSDAYRNTGMGTQALYNYNESGLGYSNTAAGYQALYSNTTGDYNVASGVFALYNNTNGGENSAFGTDALYANTVGNSNTACGFHALFLNTTGNSNTASGTSALQDNTTGYANTALGYEALVANKTGFYNSAFGYRALYSNTTGIDNMAVGLNALFYNTTGNENTAFGRSALQSITTGSDNVAQGYEAGFNLTTGDYNIDIANVGEANDSGVIRIGTVSRQTQTFVAGIYGTSVSGSAVVVSASGQLGVTVSSERFKTAIAPMGTSTAKLGELRPVTFHLKTDPHGFLQYGLIAEEVAKVYPELVIRGERGRIDGVRYDELAPMLLNEVQQQQTKNSAQDAKIRDLEQQVAKLTILNRATQVALRKLQSKDQIVAQR